MGDAADILGVKGSGPVTVNSLDDVGRLTGANKSQVRDKRVKPKGMSRELFALMGKDGIAPAMQPAKNMGKAFKSKWTSALKGKWVFSEYANSARLDKVKFKHWMKADVDYQDYTYAKFSVRAEPVMYTDEEYDELLHSSTWTRSETDHLMFLSHKFDLRWPVIVDRYSPKPPRTLEDLQARYYLVVTKVRAYKANATEGNMRNEAHTALDMEGERVRRMQQEIYLRKAIGNKDREEKELRDELKLIDAHIKKLKKTVKPTGTKASTAAAAAATAAVNKIPVSLPGVTVGPAFNVDNNMVSMPEPVSGRPALQSSRLMVVESTPGMSQTLSKKANWMLRELNVPDYPMATRTVCDMLDNVRKDVVSLLSVQSAIQKVDRELQMAQQVTVAMQGMTPAEASAKRSATMVSSDVSSSSSVATARDSANELIIPHSMLASWSDYRPAPLQQSLSSNHMGMGGPSGARKMGNQKRKGMDSGGVYPGGLVQGAEGVDVGQYISQGAAPSAPMADMSGARAQKRKKN